MIDREAILKRVQKNEDRLLISHVLDRIYLSEKTGKTTHTDFLDPHQQSLVDRALTGTEDIIYAFNGGYAGAERAVAVFKTDFYDDDDEEFFGNIFKLLNIKLNNRDNLSHRDYLGSLMGLGIKREKTGDIIVGDDRCDIVVMSEVSRYICSSLEKVGNTGVEVSIGDIADIRVPEPKVREIRVTVASLRLDCAAAPGFGLSRSKAAEHIKAGRLSLNWEQNDNPGKLIKEGDNLSIRGKGRVVVEKIGGKTKKDRIAITLMKYV